MKTYSTYQEAKIANPESEIVTLIKPDSDLHGLFEPKSVCHIMHPDGDWHICNPADYCMTVEQFLKDGHEFVEGDLLYSECVKAVIVVSDGYEVGVKSYDVESSNELCESDGCRYILRAAALEKPKQISDTAREVFSGIERRTKVEFVPCDFSDAWEAVKAYCDGEELFDVGEDKVHCPEVALKLWIHGRLYRRIETQMTEREVFIDAYAWAVQDGKSNVEDIAGMLFDSGKFKLVN